MSRHGKTELSAETWKPRIVCITTQADRGPGPCHIIPQINSPTTQVANWSGLSLLQGSYIWRLESVQNKHMQDLWVSDTLSGEATVKFALYPLLKSDTLSEEATVKFALYPLLKSGLQRVDLFSEGTWVQQSKQIVTKVVSLVQNGDKCTQSA